MDNKVLIDALEQIPALIQAAETFKGTTNHIIATFSEELKKHSLAEIPEEELRKIQDIITNTPCAQPDIRSISRELARRISTDVAEAVGPAVKFAADEALKKAAVTVEHSHYLEKDLRKIVDEKVKKKFLILWSVITILLSTIGISVISYYNGEVYWGKQYYDVYTSEYLTPEEKANLRENSFLMSVLPRNYFEDSATAQLQIKQFKKTLKKREADARKKK